MGISYRHKNFADIFLSDPRRNATAAYKICYPDAADSTASVNGNKLLKRPSVKDYIERIERRSSEKVEADVTWVKQKLKRFSEAKITDYFKVDKQGKIIVKDLKKLPPEMIDCIQSMTQTKDGYIKITLVDKKGSVSDLGKSLGMFEEDEKGDKYTQINFNVTGVTKI